MATFSRDLDRILAEYRRAKYRHDKSAVGKVKHALEREIRLGAEILDDLQDKMAHALRLRELGDPEVRHRNTRLRHALEDCICDLEEILKVLEQDQDAGLEAQYPLPVMHSPESLGHGRRPQNYVERARLLRSIRSHYGAKAEDLMYSVRMSVLHRTDCVETALSLA